MSSRRVTTLLGSTSALAVIGGLLLGTPPATAGTAYGIVVTASVTPRTWLAVPSDEYRLTFRAQPGMQASDIGVRRVGNSLVVFEELGGPSLGVADTTYCKGNNASGPSSEVTCTFPAPKPGTDWVAKADFSDAPVGATFIIEEGSAVRAEFTGSPYDDYFQGGDLGDTASGGDGGDNLYGGGSNDALWGEDGEDDIEGGPGPDAIRGGPGADNLNGEGEGVKGMGDTDSIVGGSGPDDIAAKDGVADFIDCGDPFARKSGVVEQGNTVEYDAKLDKPIDCGTMEIPSALVMPTINTTTPKVGETITGTLGEWRGTAPITYGFVFERCPFNLAEYRPCTEIKRGALDAKGLANGKPPAYTVTKADQGYAIQFSVSASNASKQGGGIAYASAPATMPVAVPATFEIPATWLPRQQGNGWLFANVFDVQGAIEASPIGAFTDITTSAVSRAKVPKQYQKAIGNGGVFEMKVNGKVVTGNPKVVVEAATDQRATIAIRYYSFLEDRKTCPVSDDGVKFLQDAVAGGKIPLWVVTKYIEASGGGTCPYVVDWSAQVSDQDTFTATAVALEETGDPDRPLQLRITATQPNLKAGLSVMVAAPPNDHVTQRPNDFSIGADGRLYAFPNKAQSSIWVGLMGDQARESGKYGTVELYVNGERVSSQSFQSTNASTTPFSTVIGHAFTETGKARIVVSTLANTPADGSFYIERQAFLDFDIVRAGTTSDLYLVTWDGRCFTAAGVRGSCPDAIAGELAGMKDVIDKSIGYGLSTFTRTEDALRYASAELDKRFVAIGVNTQISVSQGRATARYRDCWLIDVFCHIGNAFEAGAQAIMKPKPTAKKPKPAKQRYVVRVRVLPLNSKSPAGGVIGEGILKVPGVGLINLDGGTLINLDGGTFSRELAQLINLDGGTLISDMGGALINLDGGTLVGLDPSSLINLDGGTLINLDGGTLINLDGGTAIPVVTFSLQRVT